MPIELKQLATFFQHYTGLDLMSTDIDLECEEYSGYTCQLGPYLTKFRKAKITPKKIGQFVTVWQRNTAGITEPFPLTAPFDFYLIAVRQEEHFGFFLFPKAVLGNKHILTTATREGKRGFRLYPDWDIPTSKQAIQTQQWQSLYFINLTTDSALAAEKANHILKAYS
ncbi:MepB family protein [Myroides sp. DW712]|uniref:MepB family protein n=1 Tax=Myroides sp. DW712 TaxID=3389800 RepID=UPI00397E8D54